MLINDSVSYEFNAITYLTGEEERSRQTRRKPFRIACTRAFLSTRLEKANHHRRRVAGAEL
jgi:hypothetical protein